MVSRLIDKAPPDSNLTGADSSHTFELVAAFHAAYVGTADTTSVNLYRMTNVESDAGAVVNAISGTKVVVVFEAICLLCPTPVPPVIQTTDSLNASVGHALPEHTKDVVVPDVAVPESLPELI